jgi:hypothetical protein
MRTSKQEEDDFIAMILSGDLLERAAEYIAEHYNPEDIFSTEQLREWALDAGYSE